MLMRRVLDLETRKQLPNSSAGARSWRGFFLGGLDTAAGVEINATTALAIPAVYVCVRVLAESVGQLPLILYRRSGRGKERAVDHPLYPILHDLPNPEVTSAELREWMVASLALRGNAVMQIERNQMGRVLGIWPLPWDDIEMGRDGASGDLFYRYTPTNMPPVTFAAREIWHVRLFGGNGLVGLSPIAAQKEFLAGDYAAQDYGARFFASAARPSGVLEHPGTMSADAQTRLAATTANSMQGLSNAHKVLILEEGMSWKSISVPPEEAQYLETRKLGRSEVAGIFRVPAHLINDLEKATFSNVEHLDIGFVKHSLMPYLVKIEQAITRDLIDERERGGLFAEHLVDGMLRGDLKSRSEAYSTLVQTGVLTRNEVRELENRNPIDGLDEPLTPLNMQAGQGDPPPDVPAQRSAAIFAPLVTDAVARLVRGEERELLKAARKAGGSVTEFRSRVGALYAQRGDLTEFARRTLGPVVETLCADAERDGVAGIAEAVRAHVDQSEREAVAIEGEDLESEVRALCERWKSERVAGLAMQGGEG